MRTTPIHIHSHLPQTFASLSPRLFLAAGRRYGTKPTALFTTLTSTRTRLRGSFRTPRRPPPTPNQRGRQFRVAPTPPREPFREPVRRRPIKTPLSLVETEKNRANGRVGGTRRGNATPNRKGRHPPPTETGLEIRRRRRRREGTQKETPLLLRLPKRERRRGKMQGRQLLRPGEHRQGRRSPSRGRSDSLFFFGHETRGSLAGLLGVAASRVPRIACGCWASSCY